jgi:HEAT repeat protein
LDKLGWIPETDGQRAAYLIASEDWESLVEWGEPAVEPLIGVISNDDWMVRSSAAGALDKLGWVPETDEQRAAYLIASMDWESLVEWGAPAVEPLIKALGNGDESSWIRIYYARALGRIGDGRAVELLIKLLEDEDEDDDVRNAAEEALEKLGHEVE